MNSLYVHIGTAKTGTTSLQKFLHDNNSILEKQGFHYINWQEYSKLEKCQKQYSRGYVNGTIPLVSTYGLWDENEVTTMWNILLEKLEHYNVILSEECIWDYPVKKTEDVIANFKEHYNKIKVIVYLRRQDLYAESLWNQGIKEYFAYDTLAENIDNNCNLNYLEKLKAIVEVVGRENLIVRVYERGQLAEGKGDIALDFLNTIGVKEQGIPFAQSESLNERLDGDFLEIKRIFNEAYCANGGNGFADIFFKEFCAANKLFNNDHKEVSFLTGDEHLQILRKYSQDNSIISTEFLGRVDEKLFYDDSYPKEVTLKVSERERVLTQMYAKIAAAEYKKYEKELIKEKYEKELIKEKYEKELIKEKYEKELIKEKYEKDLIKEKEENDSLRNRINELEVKLEHKTIKGAWKYLISVISNRMRCGRLNKVK